MGRSHVLPGPPRTALCSIVGRMPRLLLRLTLASAPLLLTLSACTPEGQAPAGAGPQQKRGPQGGRAPSTAPVEVLQLEQGPISDGIEATSTVEARLAAPLRAGLSGTLGAFDLEEGSPVKKGQVLARIDRPGTAAQLTKARAQANKARADLRALASLTQEGLVPAQQQDDAQFNLRSAELEVERLTQERELEQLVSPLTGVVTARLAHAGEAVTAGSVIFELADLSVLEAHLHIPERHLPRVRPGQRVELSAEGLGQFYAEATIGRVAPTVDPASGTIKVTVALGDGQLNDQLQLRPGMYVRARIITETRPNALRIPKRALVREDERVFAFRVREDSEGRFVEKRPLQLGFSDRDQIEVREGLELGDRIVIFGQRGLSDGARVRIVEAPDSQAAPDTQAPSGAQATPEDAPQRPRQRPSGADRPQGGRPGN